MEYVYVAMWFLAGLLVLVTLHKEHKVFYFVGIFFFVMGAWWLADLLLEADLFAGVYRWIFSAIVAVALVVCALVYWKEKKKDRLSAEDALEAMEEEEELREEREDETEEADAGEDGGEGE